MGPSVELVAEESPDAIQAQAFDAAKTGDLNALQDVLANGAELEAWNTPYRDTVLNIAITHGNTDLAVWLLELRWPRLVGQLGGLFKVYSDCHSYRQDLSLDRSSCRCRCACGGVGQGA